MTNHNQVVRPGEVTHCEKAAEDIFPPKPWLDPGEGWRLLEDGEIVRDGDEAVKRIGEWWKVMSPGRTLKQYLEAFHGVVAVRRRAEPKFIDLQPGMQVTIPTESTDLSRILDALDGDNADQKRLAEVGLSLVAIVLRKNTDYQNSAWQVPRFAKHLDARTAILVRMGDKVARLERILANDAQVTDEPVEATVSDLAGYAIVLMAAPKETGQ